MKLKLTKLIASTVVLAVMSASAIAQEGEKKGKKKGKGKPAAERPERPERPQGAGQRGARPERSPEEMLKTIKQRLADNEKFAEMFTKRADSDEDGKLSDEEIKAAIAKMAERRKNGGEAGRQRGPRGPRPDETKPVRPDGSKSKGPRGPRPEGKKPKGPRGEKKGRPALEE